MADEFPTAGDEGFELIPPETDPVAPEDELNAATAALDDDAPAPEDDPRIPFGVSWSFDWEAGRFRRQGMSPARVSGLDTLREWCMMALNSARFAHVVFSEEFGIDDPNEPIGEAMDSEAESDYEEKIRTALIVHDRIADVTDFEMEYDPTEGILYIDSFRVVTDEDEELLIGDLQLGEEA